VVAVNVNDVVPSRRRAALVTLFGGQARVIVSTAAALILIPFYLTHIGAELYGAWLGSGGILAWLAVLDLGLASLMVQKIAEAYGRGDRTLIGEYFSTGFALQVIVVLLLVVAAKIIAPVFPRWMGIDGSAGAQLSTAFVLAAVANGLSILNNGIVGFLKALQITVLPNAVSIAGVVIGGVSTLLLLLSGYGLVSIPVGLILAVLSQIGVNGAHSMLVYRREIRAPLRPSGQTTREFLAVSGPMFVSKLSSAAAYRSDATFIAILIRPELATAYVLTRRAGDIATRLLDLFGEAAFAPFAHLAGGAERSRASGVHRHIVQGYVGAGVIMIGTFFATNATFVTLWVGPEFFLGQDLTLLIGVAILLGGGSSLVNYLLGATGRITTSAWINVAEASARVPVMLLFLATLGVAGLPLAILLTAPIAAWVSARRTFDEVCATGNPFGGNVRVYAVHISILAAGALVGSTIRPQSWIGFAWLVGGFAAVAGGIVVAVLPSVRALLLPRRLLQRFGIPMEMNGAI
jgi:O-antigen/teichoic acid export membrane protein